MATGAQFNAQMRELANKIREQGPAIKRAVGAQILQTVVMATPVGNKDLWNNPSRARPGYVGGRARANWIVGIGAGRSESSDAVDPGGNATIQAGMDAIAGAGSESIHLCNNLPYIIPLNEGHSHLAPSGFIDVAVEQGAQHGLQVGLVRLRATLSDHL